MTLGRIREYDVLVLTSLIWFLGKFVRYAFPPLFEPLQASYGVSNAAVGPRSRVSWPSMPSCSSRAERSPTASGPFG